MREIVILIPDIEVEQNVEIEVRINGRKRTIQYKVELLSFDAKEQQTDDKVTVLKHKIKEYEKDWELVEIGAPDKQEKIPLMFRKKPGAQMTVDS